MKAKYSANTMNCQLPDIENRCPFNELEFRRMAEQFDSYLKRDRNSKQVHLMIPTHQKKHNKKKRRQFDLLEVEFQMSLLKRPNNITIH
jgi:hypothetical protein